MLIGDKKQTGISILLVILIMGALLIVSLTASDLVIKQTKLSIYSGESSRAYYAAESGIEEGLYKLRKEVWLPSSEEIIKEPVYMDEETYYSLAMESEGLGQIIRSEGNYKNIKRKIEARY